MDQPPFGVDHELCDRLQVTPRNGIKRCKPSAHNGAVEKPTEKEYLPGEPRIHLNDPDIGKHLKSELITEDLDRLEPYLWLLAKQDSTHISSLTDQVVRGRKIIITEKPELHLIWYYDRVFIKPLPKYLLSHAFWEFYLLSPHSPIEESLRKDITRAARGFLRSYDHLIKHKSDFTLAKDDKHRLLPKNVTYTSFINLIKSCEVDENIVSKRYKFGELRLTRLNFWSKIFLGRFTYHKVEGQYGAYFARYYAPILFAFGVFSVLLSAMQVALAVQTIVESDESWMTFAKVSRGFSVFTVFFVALVISFLLFALIALSSREVIYALKDLYHKRNSRAQADYGGHAFPNAD